MDYIANFQYMFSQCIRRLVLMAGFPGAGKHWFVVAHCRCCRCLEYLLIFVTIANGTVALLPTFRRKNMLHPRDFSRPSSRTPESLQTHPPSEGRCVFEAQGGASVPAGRVWARQAGPAAWQPAAEPLSPLRPCSLPQAPPPSRPGFAAPQHPCSLALGSLPPCTPRSEWFCLSRCLSVTGVPSITAAVPEEQRCQRGQPEEGSYTVTFQWPRLISSCVRTETRDPHRRVHTGTRIQTHMQAHTEKHVDTHTHIQMHAQRYTQRPADTHTYRDPHTQTAGPTDAPAQCGRVGTEGRPQVDGLGRSRAPAWTVTWRRAAEEPVRPASQPLNGGCQHLPSTQPQVWLQKPRDLWDKQPQVFWDRRPPNVVWDSLSRDES